MYTAPVIFCPVLFLHICRMRIWMMIVVTTIAVTILVSFSGENLRGIYSGSSANWPTPHVEKGIPWTELGTLPRGPLAGKEDSLRPVIELGKTLFFDPRLSASGKISCASCHQPSLNWTDGRETSIGHEGAIGKRNAPGIANSWFYKRLFWDGRARDLADQAFAPIVSESEMASDMPDVMSKLRRIDGYRKMFRNAFGDDHIDPERMTQAIALFEQTVISRKSAFDLFLQGNRKALSNAAIRGLHLFRTKAGCMNCHYGPLMTDNSFHAIGFSGEDAGYFKVTHQDADSGKFRTPSLRDVMRTGPWMHDGKEKEMTELLEKLNHARMPGIRSQLVKPLGLTKREKADLLAFLQSISAPAADFQTPVLPE